MASQMNVRLLKIFSSDNRDESKKEVEEILARGPEAWAQLVDFVTCCGDDQIGRISACVLSSMEHRTEGQIEFKRRIFKAVYERLKQRMPESRASEVLSCLRLSAERLPAKLILRLTREVVSDVVDGGADPNVGAWLDILPKLLELVSSADVVADGADRIRGPDFRRHAVCSIAGAAWAPDAAVRISSVLVDADLDPEETESVVRKLESCMRDASVFDLPGVAYQLLNIDGREGRGHRVLHELARIFREHVRKCRESAEDEADSINSAYKPPYSLKQVYDCQGTVILHICSLLERGSPLGDEIAALAKESSLFLASVLDPFVLSVFVAVARLEKYQEPILDSLRAAFVGHLKDMEQLKDSSWLREVAPPAWQPERVISEAVNVAVFAGCEPVAAGLLDLAFALVKVSGKEDAALGIGAARLATDILVKLAKRDGNAIRKILDTIAFQLICCRNPRLLAEIFSKLAKSAGNTLISRGVEQLKRLCTTIGMLPFPVARNLLYSLAGFLRYSVPLRDTLIIALKKLLFSPVLNSRMVGLSGMLILVEHNKVVGCTRGLSTSTQMGAFSLSQMTADGFARPSTANECKQRAALALAADVLFTLRRCLTQQAEVKRLLYHGLSQAVRKNPDLAPVAINFLMSHLKRFVKLPRETEDEDDDEDEDGGGSGARSQRQQQRRRARSTFPPLDLNACVSPVKDEGFRVDEPIGDLLLLVSDCLLSCGDGTENAALTQGTSAEVDGAKRVVGRVCAAYADVTADAVVGDRDDAADLSPFTNGGQFNVLQARLHMSVVEALVQSVWRDAGGPALAEDRAEEMVLLFRLHEGIHDRLNEKEKVAAKAKKASTSGTNRDEEKKSTLKLPPFKWTFSAHFLESCISALFNDDVPAHQAGLSVLRNRTRFVLALLDAWQELIGCQPENQLVPLPSLQQVGKVLLHHCGEVYASTEDSDRIEVTKSLEALDAAQKLVKDVHPNKFWTYMNFVSGTPTPPMSKQGVEVVSEEHILEPVKVQVEVLKKVLGNVLEDDEKIAGKAVVPAASLLVSLTRLSCELPGNYAKSVSDWLGEAFMKDGHSLDAAGMKALMAAWTAVTLMAVSLPKCAKQLTRRVVHLAGSVLDESVDEGDPGDYAMLADKAWLPVVVPALCSYLDRVSEYADSTVARLKRVVPLCASGKSTPFFVLPDLHQLEPKICTQTGVPCYLHGLLVSAKLNQVGLDALLRSIVRSVNVQTNLARYFMVKLHKLKGDGAFPQKYPEKVVNAFCHSLAPRIPEVIFKVENEKVNKTTKKSDPSLERARILRKTKGYSDVIFALEKYEQVLLQLSNKSKVNLLQGAKLPTARDFQIDKKVLAEELRRGSPEPPPSASSFSPAPSQQGNRRRRRDDDGDGDGAGAGAGPGSGPSQQGSQAPARAQPTEEEQRAKRRRRTLGARRKKTLNSTPSSAGSR